MQVKKVSALHGMRDRRRDEMQAVALKRRQQKRRDIEEINDFERVLNEILIGAKK